MTKYISSKGACRVQAWHNDPNCDNIKAEAVEASESQLAYHELTPCCRCVQGYSKTNMTVQEHKWSHLQK